MTSNEQLSTYCKQFEDSENTTRPARQKSELCRDYFDDKQHTSDEEAALKNRGQPVVTFNEIKPKVKTMLGLEKQTRKDPKAFPRNPDDEDAARAATDAIRYVCDDSRWDDKRSRASKHLAIEGTGIVMIGVKRTKEGLDPDIRSIAWDRFYYDPQSSEDDFEDAAFLGQVIWMDLDAAKQKFPDATEALEGTWLSGQFSETYDDKPKHGLWSDYKRRRVRICEHYYIEQGKWMLCLFTKGGFVVEPMPSPYMGDDGEPECPIKAISLYVDRDNNRYGEVQAMISPQDEINKRRSKSLHTVNTRQVRVSPSVGQDADAVRKELSRPDGVFIGEHNEVEILNTSDMLAGNLNLMMDAREHIHRTGANSALAGKDTNTQSGKAIALQQMGGMTEAADYLDCIRRLSLAVYRSVWSRIRQHWNAERWIRVTDNEKNVRFVGLNKPVTGMDEALKQLGDKVNDPAVQQQLAFFAQTPQARQVVRIENNVTELDVDILVDEGVDTPTVAAEQFDTIVKMLPGAPPNLQPALWEMAIQSSALRDKDKLAEAMKQAPSPEQQQQQQLQMRGVAADVADKEAGAQLKLAQAQKAAQPEPQQAPEQPDPMDAAISAAELDIKRNELEIKRAEVAIKRGELEIKRGELGVDVYAAQTDRITAMQPSRDAQAA
ncbi:MAG: hypothetical protein V4527_18120 [Pseudomonadota bacterium]